VKYVDELSFAMNWLAKKKNVRFLGQAVAAEGTGISNTLRGVPLDIRHEIPVAEVMQMGMSIGLALNGIVPVTIFPRWNFLLLTTDMLVNHADKLEQMSDGELCPGMIIRTAAGSVNPLWPGPQHVGDFTEAFRLMCPNINFVRLEKPCEIFTEYKLAFTRAIRDGRSTVLTEVPDYYNTND